MHQSVECCKRAASQPCFPLEIHPDICIPTMYVFRKHSFPETANLVHRLLPETETVKNSLQRMWPDSLTKNALDNSSFQHLVIIGVLEFPVENTAYIQLNSKHGKDWPSEPSPTTAAATTEDKTKTPKSLKYRKKMNQLWEWLYNFSLSLSPHGVVLYCFFLSSFSVALGCC